MRPIAEKTVLVTGATGVTATALHPATCMPTKMVATAISTLKSGVDATVRLVLDRALDGVSGRYYNGRRQARAHRQAYDPAARARLRTLSEQLTGLTGVWHYTGDADVRRFS